MTQDELDRVLVEALDVEPPAGSFRARRDSSRASSAGTFRQSLAW